MEVWTMKTNVKNGLIFLGEVATDTATIRIGDIAPSQFDFEFITNADGFYPVLAETNESGMVERIFIDVNPRNWNLFEYDEVTMIDPDDIITGEIESHEISECDKCAELRLGAILRNLKYKSKEAN